VKMVLIIGVVLGGGIGALTRYGISAMLNGEFFPWGTLASNVLAALVIGFIIGLQRVTGRPSGALKTFFTTGCLGGLSTFSTFSLETVTLLEHGRFFVAAGNIILNVFLCITFVFAGLALAKVIMAQC
jgi:CrcB protein